MNKEKIFKKINKYFKRKKYQFIMSIYMEKYYNKDLYIRFDYDYKHEIYRLSWINFLNLNGNDFKPYICEQIIDYNFANRIIDIIDSYEIKDYYDERPDSDAVEIVCLTKNGYVEYIIDRFLPKQLDFLIDPVVLLFSFLPRSYEYLLDCFFAIFDNNQDKYLVQKPLNIRIDSPKLKELFKNEIIQKAYFLFQTKRILFLEKQNDKYISVVKDNKNNLVIIQDLEPLKTKFYCTCQNGFCHHIYATILAVNNNKFKSFYKVKYIASLSLLEKTLNGGFNLCYGFEDGKFLLIGNNGKLIKKSLYLKNQKAFEIIEDDDNYTLTKSVENYEKK